MALRYAPARRDIDLTYRPENASGGAVRFKVGKRIVVVRRKRGGVFSVRAPAGRGVTVMSARDRHGNVASGRLGLER